MIAALFIFSLCWGSFLNVLAYRLLKGEDWITKRSRCPQCEHVLAWYDLIPLLSWLLLKGRCRYCHGTISWLYPAIELLTAVLFTLLWILQPHLYFPAYALFFSGLIVTIRTDLEHMLIPRLCTWGLIPFGILASSLGFLPLSDLQSVLGMIFGYALLWLVAKIFVLSTKREGLGLGDVELLSCIGAFTGIIGAWLSLVVASCVALVVGIIYALATKQTASLRYLKIPFGPFLAIGAIMYVFASSYLEKIFLGI